jgi:REP element-mobilizing transposase RayT
MEIGSKKNPMARKPRIHYPAALYHVMLRGNARQDVFFDDEDRYRFYLGELPGTFLL